MQYCGMCVMQDVPGYICVHVPFMILNPNYFNTETPRLLLIHWPSTPLILFSFFHGVILFSIRVLIVFTMNLIFFGLLATCLGQTFKLTDFSELTPPSLNSLKRRSCEHSPTSRACWGDYSIDTDYYAETPHTGVTRGTVQILLRHWDMN